MSANPANILGPVIRQLRKNEHMTQRELSRLTGIAQNTISNHENQNRSLDENDIIKYAKALKVTPQYLYDQANVAKNPAEVSALLNGVPINADERQQAFEVLEKILPSLETRRVQKVAKYASDQLDKQQNNVISLEEAKAVLNESRAIHTDIDIYGVVSAGTGEFQFDSNDVETVSYRGAVPPHDYALKVNGDSMQPMLEDGQIIFVRESNGSDIYNGQIVIALLNDEAFVKKIDLTESAPKLVSLNPDYDPIQIQEDDEFEIQGIVIL